MTTSVHSKVVEKIIASLKTVSDVTKYVGSGSSARIYGSHLSTIQDQVLPAISIYLLDGRTDTSNGFFTTLNFQVDLWFNGTGKQAYTWDDVVECQQAIVNQLHRNGGWDNSIGVKILEMTHLGNGPQIYERDNGVLHLPMRWTVRASV